MEAAEKLARKETEFRRGELHQARSEFPEGLETEGDFYKHATETVIEPGLQEHERLFVNLINRSTKTITIFSYLWVY